MLNILAAISIIMMFLTNKLSTKINLQFFISCIIAFRLSLNLNVVYGISLFVLELLVWISLWPGIRLKVPVNHKFSAKVYSRKIIAILMMIIGCSFALIISKTNVAEKKLISSLVSDNSVVIIFVLILIMFFSNQIGERK